MKFLIIFNVIFFSLTLCVNAQTEKPKADNNEESYSIVIVCDKPDSVITEGKRFSLNDRDKKKMESITIQLAPNEKKVRFKRAGRWSSWFAGNFSEQEVSWSLVDIENESMELDEKFSNFQYWKFNLDLINRKVFENFVRKKTPEEEQALEVKTLPTVFSYPGCKKIESVKLK
ncbi:MAG: hypothetical protein CFH01_00791 [Alphaproteobacteria bacterium MarineAlpha2_Bin1]|nr:MAG: hypothetical protein CFH01_00791 [Alphaproteobacteria bacterium MarineAlpha2_Bin1]